MIEEKYVSIISNEKIDKTLDANHYGFLTQPKFSNEGTELDIIFDLLVPVTQHSHVITKAGCRYFLHEIKKEEYANSPQEVANLVHRAMKHTIAMFKQENPEYDHIEIPLFDSKHFLIEVNGQMLVQGITAQTN
jgi:hypothetical protein